MADHSDNHAAPEGYTSKHLRLFRCEACGTEEYRTQYWVPLPEGQRPAYKGEDRPLPVYCHHPECASVEPCVQVLTGIKHDLLPESFIIDDLDGKGTRRVSSLTELRQIERESEQRHRNGEGQILNWRDFSQDRGNSRENSFKGSSYETGRSRRPESRRTVSGLPIDIRAVRPK